MASTAITTTPKDLVSALSLVIDQEYYLQNSGCYTVDLHEDRANSLTVDNVRTSAGERPFVLEPRSQTPLRYKVRADTPLWAWASGLPTAIAAVQAP